MYDTHVFTMFVFKKNKLLVSPFAFLGKAKLNLEENT